MLLTDPLIHEPDPTLVSKHAPLLPEKINEPDSVARDPLHVTLMNHSDAPSFDTSTLSDLPSATTISLIVRLTPSTIESAPPYNPPLKLNPSDLIDLTPPQLFFPPQRFVYEDFDPRGTDLSVPFEMLRTDPLIHEPDLKLGSEHAPLLPEKINEPNPAARDPLSVTLIDQSDAAAVSVVPSRAFVKVDPLSCKIITLDPSTIELALPYNPPLKLNPSDLIDLRPPPPLYPPQKFVYKDLDPRGTDLSVLFEMLRTDPLIHKPDPKLGSEHAPLLPEKINESYLVARDPLHVTLMDQSDAPSFDTSTLYDLLSTVVVSVVPLRAIVKVDPLSCKIVRLNSSTIEPASPYNPLLKLNPTDLIDLTPPPPLYPPQKFVYDDLDPQRTNLSIPFEMLQIDPLIHESDPKLGLEHAPLLP
ncbi:hypothetical protein KY285_017565 [Solanum tuberosum]|nr:hypothetical protein KY285_017565 [Solanum tuberosum]